MEIINRLRAPDGCPWDRSQTHESLKPCMVNETAEALAAIDVWRETGDSSNLCEELGDMLLQVVLQSQIAREEGLFTIWDVIQKAGEKMLRRHPHVFGAEKGQAPPDWEAIKRAEKEGISPDIEDAKRHAMEKARTEIIAHIQGESREQDKKP